MLLLYSGNRTTSPTQKSGEAGETSFSPSAQKKLGKERGECGKKWANRPSATSTLISVAQTEARILSKSVPFLMCAEYFSAIFARKQAEYRQTFRLPAFFLELLEAIID